MSIIFLTDGNDNKNDKKMFKQKQELREALFNADLEKNIVSSIYCLGLSKFHDADLLNFLAQAGSLTGNFIYVDTDDPNIQKLLKVALFECLNIAIQSTDSKD